MIMGVGFFLVIGIAALYLEKIDAKVAVCYSIALILSVAIAWRTAQPMLVLALPYIFAAVLALHAGIGHEHVSRP